MRPVGRRGGPARHGRPVVAVVALVLVVLGCGPSPSPAPSAGVRQSSVPATPAGSVSGADLRNLALQDLIDGWAADNDPVGVAAAALYPDGDLWLGSAGLSDREQGITVDPAGRFEIGSVTKTFMAVLALRLAEEGVIDLDATIDGCLPEFPAAEDTTIRMLLGHRAGVGDPIAQLVSDRLGPPDTTRIFTPPELLAAAADRSPVFRPGSRHDYSNANYWVLAACLEAATGTDVSALLDETIFGPLDLDDTLLFDSTLPEVEVVNAYKDLDLDGVEDPTGPRPLPGFITPAWTAGGIISSASDVARFLDAALRGGFLSDESLAEMMDPLSGGGTYALGIYRVGPRWGHDGGIEGYLSAAFHNPATGVTVVVLTNRFGPDAPQADALAPLLGDLADDFAGAPPG